MQSFTHPNDWENGLNFPVCSNLHLQIEIILKSIHFLLEICSKFVQIQMSNPFHLTNSQLILVLTQSEIILR